MPVAPGTYVTDNVRLVRLLREGTMGQVWLADHERLHAEVVVKFISEKLLATRQDARRRFEAEASTTAQIKSPHVLQIYDSGEMPDGTPYMVMELLEGESLHERLEREGTLEPRELAEVMRQVGNALDLAHAKGIVHRDIKPQNIYLTHVHGELLVKLVDFGIAKRADEHGADLTQPGMVVGTIYYMSPERIGSGNPPDHRVDLWALAVVAYKALTATLPFTGADAVETCMVIRDARFRRPSKIKHGLAPALDDWFARAFLPDPDARYSSAQQMARTFKEALEGTDSAGRPSASSLPPSVPPGQRRKALHALLDVVGLQFLRRWVPRSWISDGALQVIGIVLCVLGLFLAVAVVRSCTSAPPRVASAPPPHPSGAAATVPAPSASTVAPEATTSAAATSSARAPAGDDMVLVEAGEFWMGCDEAHRTICAPSEQPGRRVTVTSFLIDRTEVTTAAFGRCVEAGACSSEHLEHARMAEGAPFVVAPACNWGKPGREQHPINCLDHAQATAFCSHAGKRLPTEAEWEKAARGADGRLFPWGDEAPTCQHTVMNQSIPGCGQQSTWPVAAQKVDVSPLGVHDMAGNLREWTADWYQESFYRDGPAADPKGPDKGLMRVVRGGSWSDQVQSMFRTWMRAAQGPGVRAPSIGLRCAKSVE